MPLAEYLASEQAREDVRKANRELDQCAGLAYGLDFGWLRADIVKIWRRVWIGLDGEVLTTAYYRLLPPTTAYYRLDGARYVVTDLGEGVRALRLRTGESAYGPATGVAMLEKLNLYDAENPRNALGGMAHELELVGVQQADLPDAICRVMLASLRVAGVPNPDACDGSGVLPAKRCAAQSGSAQRDETNYNAGGAPCT